MLAPAAPVCRFSASSMGVTSLFSPVKINGTDRPAEGEPARSGNPYPFENAALDDDFSLQHAFPIFPKIRVPPAGDVKFRTTRVADQQELNGIGQIIRYNRSTPSQEAGQSGPQRGSGGARLQKGDGEDRRQPDAEAENKPQESSAQQIEHEAMVVKIEGAEQNADQKINTPAHECASGNGI